MKSLIQEGSSIFKAIEKAWTAAGEPKEFSVKIFEESKRNFIGMTTQAAKIGLFFQEPKVEIKEIKKPKKILKQYPEPQTEQRKQHLEPQRQQRRQQQDQQPRQATQVQPQTQHAERQVIWSDEMIAQAEQWLKESLEAINKPNISFQTSTNNYQLRFNFADAILDDQERERNLFRSFSFLLLQTLKRRFKRPLRGFKIVLTRIS